MHFRAGRKVAFGEGKGPCREKNCNLQAQKMAGGCILNCAAKPKMEIPDQGRPDFPFGSGMPKPLTILCHLILEVTDGTVEP